MNTICKEATSVRQMLDAAAGWHDIDELEDYKAVIGAHVNLSNHHRRMAVGYVARCLGRHQVQFSLWDLDGEQGEVENEIDQNWA